MKNEHILIFGDSYSTYRGYIPEGYAAYYPYADIPSVDDVSKTWWGMLAEKSGSTILLNNSWSGSTICNTGYNGDCSKTSSFIFRLGQLIESGYFKENQIDRVLVFGGTNDCWTENTVGEVQFSDFEETDLFRVLPGISCFAYRLSEVMPREKVHFIINSNLTDAITEGMVEICRHFGFSYTRLEGVEKHGGHPTYLGMCAICEQVMRDLA